MKNRSSSVLLCVCAGLITLVSCSSNQPTETYNPNETEKTSLSINSADSFAVLEKTLQLDSSDLNLRIEIAEKYYSADNFEKAQYHFLKVYQADHKNLPALTGLGNINYDTKQYDKAIEYYQKALTLDNKNTNIRCDMATCYLSINLPEKALRLLKENIAIDFNHAQSHHNMSIIYKQLGKQKEADDEMKIFNDLSSQ